MLAIEFDGRLFTTIQGLSDYIVAEYDGWQGVPDDHPQSEVVKALTSLSIRWYSDGEYHGEVVRTTP